MLNNIKKQSGFTIVELLIVIVVIAILAAISIVAYNGIQNRGKTSASQSLAGQIAKKAEAYNTTEGQYPTFDQFSNNKSTAAGAAANTASQESRLDDNTTVVDYGTGTTVGTQGTYVSGSKNLVVYRLTNATGTSAGGCVYYWDYAKSPAGQVSVKVGAATTC